MLVQRVITSLNRQSVAHGKLRTALSFNTTASTLNLSQDEEEKPERKLKEWRTLPVVEQGALSMFNARVPKGTKYVLPREQLRLGPVEMKRWWRTHKTNYIKNDQRFIPKRHETLGCDLAAAHFLVHRGGKVKFYGQEDWKEKGKDGVYKLPSKYDPAWQLSHIDASGIPLYYEGIENIENLIRVSWASFSKNENLDDWCLDKISANLTNIEYLDISDCPLVTERGLEAFYRLYNLKTLIITDWHKTVSFELTCAMLEDCNPGLTIEIKDARESGQKEDE